MMIDLFGMTSPNVHKVSIMLEELDLSYNFYFVSIAGGEQFQPDFIAKNPMGRVPVLVDHEGPDGRPYTVFESGAILLYLAEKHERFLPKTGEAHFEVLKWLMVQMGNVGPLLGQLTHFTRFAPEDQAYSRSRYRTLAGRVYDALERRLADTPYLANGEYSVADIATYPWISLYHEKHGMDWADHPHLLDWCKRIGERPGVARADAKYASRDADDPSNKPGHTADDFDRVFGRGRHTRA
jgi:GSH-dependent disulfide-bond oxidoreductase